jgi:hypothetical protein
MRRFLFPPKSGHDRAVNGKCLILLNPVLDGDEERLVAESCPSSRGALPLNSASRLFPSGEEGYGEGF